MPRSGEDARRRLQKAALELWSDRGYDATTTAQIAERAGVTERTFFRHFPDKREVLFDGATPMRAILIEAVERAPKSVSPLNTLLAAFKALEPMFEDNRPYSGLRQKIIAGTPALRERELAKFALLTTEVAEALERRGVNARLAILAAQIGRTAFEHAVSSWIDNPTERLSKALDRSFKQLRGLF
jgi:AcrR family transcriptional regulator